MPQGGDITQNIPEDWEAQGTLIPDGDRDWQALERPPADWFDYFFYQVIESLKDLDANAVLNVNGIPEIRYGLLADRPAAGTDKRIYITSDTYEVYIDNGASWDLYTTLDASKINYDNSDSNLNSNKVKNALDELANKLKLSDSGTDYNLTVVNGSLALEEV